MMAASICTDSASMLGNVQPPRLVSCGLPDLVWCGCCTWGQPGPPRYRTCGPGVGARGPWNKAGGVLASRRGPTLARIAARRRVAEEAPVSALSRPPERPSGLMDLAWSRVASEGQDNRNGPTEPRGTAVLASGQASGGRRCAASGPGAAAC